MTVHRIARTDLEVALTQIVRSGEHIDKLHLDGDEWVVITDDRIETRPALGSRDMVERLMPSADPARIVAAIKEYESVHGKGWRS